LVVVLQPEGIMSGDFQCLLLSPLSSSSAHIIILHTNDKSSCRKIIVPVWLFVFGRAMNLHSRLMGMPFASLSIDNDTRNERHLMGLLITGVHTILLQSLL
jgi:hypothetical protein